MSLRLGLMALALAGIAAAQASPPLPFDAGSPDRIRQSLRGRPYVLAFWSTHCAPCAEEMGVWRALGARHPGMTIVLVSTDPPGERAQVLEFLRRHDPGPVQRWQYADALEERIRYAVDPKWRGELPRTYFHGRDREPVALTGAVDGDWVSRWFEAASAP